MEAAHKPHLDELAEKLTHLNKAFHDETARVTMLEKQVAYRRAELKKVYTQAGLSADEIVERLSALDI